MSKAHEQRIEAAKAALDWSKQILTLATGTLVLSGTFIKEVFHTPVIMQEWIIACWILMSASVLFGLLFLGVIVNVLSEKSGADVDVYSNRWVAILHVLTFLVGLICFVVFISCNLTNANVSIRPNVTNTPAPH